MFLTKAVHKLEQASAIDPVVETVTKVVNGILPREIPFLPRRIPQLLGPIPSYGHFLYGPAEIKETSTELLGRILQGLYQVPYLL